MSTIVLRFQKLDQYDNFKFIVNPEKEPESYATLQRIEAKLKTLTDSFIPVYTTKDYATITFKKYGLVSHKSTMIESGVYGIDFVVRKTNPDKDYLSCFIKKIKLISKPNMGEIIDLDL